MVLLFAVTAVLPAVGADEAKTKTLGDVNGDGNITANDALLTLQQSVGKTDLGSGVSWWAANADGNEVINASDALLILQSSVGKTELEGLIIDDYAEYEYRYVEPVGLEKNTIYVISAGRCFKDKNIGTNKDAMRLGVCVQGLINRNNDKHKVAVTLRNDETDTFWLNFISEEGATYDTSVYTQKTVGSADEYYTIFGDFIRSCGIVVWDPDVPSTSNVASTICGLYNYLPVQYSTDENSIYMTLTRDYGVKVKMSLVGMFGEAKLGTKIKGTDIASTGSAKCDAYMWALENYMEECNPELLAYTPDGAVAVASNWLAQRGDASNANSCGIPNHDYFIARQCFFFDLTSYGGEAPCDDPEQPLGTDPATLRAILLKRYNMTGGKWGTAIGFPPWHLKYTNHIDPKYHMGPPRLEWHFVEFVTSYNIGIEADAAHPCWMSNASLYYKYQTRYSPRGNAPAKEEIFDPDTHYYTVVWSGDFDCSPWMKYRMQSQWSDEAGHGTVPMAFGYNVNLSQRIPMAFDYVFSKQTESDYLVAGEGMGYVFPSALWQGFKGKEATYSTDYKGPDEKWAAKRLLSDGAQDYYDYAKPYYEKLGMNITARLLDGFNTVPDGSLAMIEKLSPGGVFIGSSSTGDSTLHRYGGLVAMSIDHMGSDGFDDDQTRAAWLYSEMRQCKYNFTAVGYCDLGTNYGTPSNLKKFIEEFDTYVSWRAPGKKYKYLDIVTFVDVVKQSGQGKIHEAVG